MAAVSKPSDHLVDVLKQIQARKTVKPEDATKALQQYKRVQDHIKELKAEIEFFKSVIEKEKQVKQNKQNGAIVRTRSLNIKNKDSGIKQPSQTVRPTSDLQATPRVLNAPSESKTSSAKPPSIRLDNKSSDKNKKVAENTPTKEPKQKPGNDPTIVKKEKDQTGQATTNAQTNGTSEKRSTSSDNTKENGTTSKGPLVLLKEFPTCNKLVENFKRIRDNEWRSAFHDLEKHYKLSEEVITELLAGIAREAYMFCTACEKQQFEDIKKNLAHVTDIFVQPRYTLHNKDLAMAKSKAILDKDGFQVTRKFLKDYRKAMARVPISGLTEIFENLVQKDVINKLTPLRITPKSTRPYIQKLVETNWLMALQDPPMAQAWPRGGQLMNRDWFNVYSKKGATIIHTVWPALFTQKDGPIAEKGICLVK